MEDDSNHAERAFLPGSGRSLTRREWVQRMLAGARIAAPTLAQADSVHAPLATAPVPGVAPAEAAAVEWMPAFFDDHQIQTLVARAERIVPGSMGAQVNRFLDTALGADTQESQRKFVTALNALEGESLCRFTKSFVDLSPSQQDGILTAASRAQPSSPDFAEATAGETRAGVRPAVPNLRDYFDHMKGWISMAYYSSEVGMKELGWTDENFFESFRGCEHADGHSKKIVGRG